MTILPQNIKERFYQAVKGGISLDDFAQWLYSDRELERHLEPDDYLDLISLNLNENGAKYKLRNLLKKHIDPGEFETYKMLELLNEAKQNNERLPYILMEFYELYCIGYTFLQDLGLGIGFAVVAPSVNNSTAETWDELTPQQQKEMLDSFSPELEKCIEELINRLTTKKIILTGKQDEMGHYNYQDFRTEKEKKSRLWVVTSENKETGSSTSKNILWKKQAGTKQ